MVGHAMNSPPTYLPTLGAGLAIMTTELSLAPVTRENYRAVCRLPTEPGDERFVASNMYSLVQAAYEVDFEPSAIVANGELVGFVMCDRDPKTDEQWICRLMIAAGRRGHGYGRAAMQAVVDRYRARGSDGLFVSFVPENRAAENIYASMGFSDTGRMEDGERVFFLKF